jgi:hypothetical protein
MELEEGMEITFLGENGNPDCVFTVKIHESEGDSCIYWLVPKDEDCKYIFTLRDEDEP